MGWQINRLKLVDKATVKQPHWYAIDFSTLVQEWKLTQVNNIMKLQFLLSPPPPPVNFWILRGDMKNPTIA